MSFLYSRKDVIKLMSNFDFTKTLLSGNKQYIDKITNDIAEKANNPDWNNLKNRPFGEETTYSDIITWNRDANNTPFTMFNETPFYLISDNTPLYENLVNGISLVISSPDGNETISIEYGDITNENGLIYSGEESLFYIVPEDNYTYTIEDISVTFPQKGVYILWENDIPYGVTSISFNGYELKNKHIKTIDSKYIPAEFVTETELNTKQDIISISTLEGTTSETTSLASGTVGTISSLKPSVAGTYLVLASARMGYTSDDESGAYNQKICLSTSTAFDSSTEASMTNIKSANVTINCWAIMTLTASDTVYLLGYQSSGSAQTVDNERMYALKIA